MKIIILSLLLVTYSFFVYGQRPVPDQVESAEGTITIHPILHSTFMLKWKDNVIYVDPYGGAKAFKGLPAPNLILITDIHGDHMNSETLQIIDVSKTTIIAPQAVNDLLPEEMKSRVIILGNHEQTKQYGLDIEAIPMYNLPETSDSRHPKGRGNGYVITLGKTRIYISGDTEDIPEMRALTNIDIAFICMNQPYTMTIEQAASAVLEFKPKIVFPFHYRGQGGFSDVEAFMKVVKKGNSDLDVRLLNWYPTY